MTINIKSNPNILVVGDLMVDQYLWGTSDRISPEAPVQIVDIDKETSVLGGAGNVINNLHALGAKVDIMSVIGNCPSSKLLKRLLARIKIDSKFLVIENNRILSKKSRIISGKQQVARFDCESSDEISAESQKILLKNFKKNVKHYDVLVLSDYNKGVLTKKISQSLISIANKLNKKVLVDPKGHDLSKYKGAYLITPNKIEASNLSNISINDDLSLKAAIKYIKKHANLNVSIITLGHKGIAVFDKKLTLHPTLAKEVFDVTGAGDTLLASISFALACNSSIHEAVEFANIAAGLVIGKLGSATVTLDEIYSYKLSITDKPYKKQITRESELVALIKIIKSKKKKIVFTNGCFDIIHSGHIKYLEQAKTFGDVLIVGLNSDSSIKELKGDKRPIISQFDRADVIGALNVVDFIYIFEDKTPEKLIKLIQPDILVKGSDYKGKVIAGSNYASKVMFADFIEGKSSTQIIEKILANE